MAIDLTTFWSTWNVVGGNTSATNQYDFWKGMIMSNGQVLNNQYEFFQYHNTTRYEWFKNLQSTYPEVYNEYTFYKNTSDARIFDMRTFYQYGASYLTPSVTPTPTPTPTMSPTPTASPTPTPTATPSGDADATAYLAAVTATGGTVDATITSAVNTLFTDLKAAGLYSKIEVLMPMVGGTKAAIVINGKYPTDDSWKWTEYGTPLTYSSNGVQGNSSAALKSNFTTSDIGITTSTGHFSMYCNLLPTNGAALNGSLDLSVAFSVNGVGYSSENWYVGVTASNSFAGTTSYPSEGYWLVDRDATDNQNFYVNDSLIFNRTTSVGANPDVNLAIMTLVFPGYGFDNDLYNGDLGNPRYCTYTAGPTTLTTQNRSDLNDIITAFNTTLGRD